VIKNISQKLQLISLISFRRELPQIATTVCVIISKVTLKQDFI